MRDNVQEYVNAARQSAERMIGLIRREVQRQMKALGLVTRDELSELKKRVRALERHADSTAPASPKTASRKKSGAKRTATARRGSGRKRPGTRSTSGRKRPGGRSI